MKKFTIKFATLIMAFAIFAPILTIQVANAAYNYNGPYAWENSKEFYFSPGAVDEVDVYYFDVPSGTTELKFDVFVMDGAPEIYINQGSVPDIEGSDYDAMDDTVDDDGWLSIIQSSPTAGTWYFAILSTTANDDTYGYPRYPLTDGVSQSITNTAGDYFEFYIKGVTQYDNLTVNTVGSDGDVELFAYDFDYDDYCYSDNNSSDGSEECVLDPTSYTADYYAYVGIISDVSDLTIQADITAGDEPSPYNLPNGATVTQTITSGNRAYFQANLPASVYNLEMESSGGSGSGDASMYYKYPGYASNVNYQISSQEVGNAEFISKETPTAPGEHNIAIYADGGDVEDLDVSARWVNGDLLKGDSKSISTSSNGEWVYYTIFISYPLTPPVSDLTVTTTGGTGDVSLYVEEGTWATTSSTDKSETPSSNEEEVVIASPTVGSTYYIGVYSSTTFSGVTLDVDYTVAEGDWVTDNIKTDGYAKAVDVYQDPSGNTYMIASMGSDGTYIYKRSGRSWYKQNTGGNLLGSRFVAIGNAKAFLNESGFGNIMMYKRSGDTWNYDSTFASGKLLASAAGDLVVTEKGLSDNTIYVYNCSSGTCVDYGSITDPGDIGGESWGLPEVMSFTPPGPGNPGGYVYSDYGNAIATDGVRIIVADFLFDHDSGGVNERQNTGKVYIYKYSGGNWVLEEGIESGDTGVDGWDETRFGYSVDISSSQAIVGAKYGEVNWVEGTRNGSAYVYEFNGTDWDEVMEIEHSDATNSGGSNGDTFGGSVGITGNYIIASAPTHNTGGNGRVYVFEKNGGTCAEDWCEIINYSPGSGFGFGNKVAISGNYYYGVSGNSGNSGPGLIILNNNPAGSSGGGGGGAVPEFSDYVLIITIAIALYFMFKLIPKIGNTPLGHA